MRTRVRLLHVLVIGPAAALAALAAPSVQARAAPGMAPPQPIVIAIDPGHGGAPNRANPSQPFDPGAIGVNGLAEKDVTLDVGKRLAALLRQDMVRAVLTRTTDEPLSVAQREQVAVDAHAALFVSIHCNWFRDPSIGGSLVLYPNSQAQAFAQTLSNALGRDLAPEQINDDGIVLRDNWWIHAPMPTSTVEMAYLSNPREAALMDTESFREDVAFAIRDGMERYDPDIAIRKAQILAWEREHGGHTPPPVRTAQAAVPHHGGRSVGMTLLLWALLAATVTLAVRRRRPIAEALMALATLFLESLEWRAPRRVAARRRRRRIRSQAPRTQRWAPRSVYDELSF